MPVPRETVREPVANALAWVARTFGRWPEPSLGSARDGRAVIVPWGVLTEHVLGVGATGSGKTTTCFRIAAAVIEAGAPSLTVDLKGSPALAGQLAAAAHLAGRPFVWWRLGRDAVRYDPLAGGDHSERAAKLLGFSAWSEPHYQNVAQDLVGLAIRVADASDGRPDLAALTDLLDPERLAAKAKRDKDLPQALRREVSEELRDLPRDQQSALSGLRRRLRVIAKSTAGDALEPSAIRPTIDLRRVWEAGGPVVLFSLNSLRYGRLAAQVAALILEDAGSALGARLEEAAGPPGLLWVDEFEVCGGEGVARLLARAREPRCGVMLSTQDFADLRKASEHLPGQVLSNVRTVIAHKCSNPETAEMIAEALGTDPQWDDTVQTHRDLLGAKRPTGLGSRRQVHHYRVHPSALKDLGRGHCVVAIGSEQVGPAHIYHCHTVPRELPAVPVPQAPGQPVVVDEPEDQGVEEAA